MSQAIHNEFQAGVVWLTLTAPTTGNTITWALVEQLTQALIQAQTNEACRVIVIRAEGADFCKGLDLEEAFTQADKPNPQFFNMFLDCLNLIRTSPQPVIASVEGHVTAGGLGLVAACDIVLALESVQFMLPEVIVGMIPAIITPFLLRRISLAQVRYLTLSSTELKAQDAKVIGLVDELVYEDMSKALTKQLKRLFRSSHQAIATSKRYFNILDEASFQPQTQIALQELLTWLAQPNVFAGIRAFAEGETPPWFQTYRRITNV